MTFEKYRQTTFFFEKLPIMQRDCFIYQVFFFVDNRSEQLQVSPTEVAERDVVINPGRFLYAYV